MHRRAFVSALTASSGLAVLRPVEPLAALESRAAQPQQGPWDLTWIEQLAGKHKQVFDFGTIDDPLRLVRAYLNAHHEVYGLDYPDVVTVVGIARAAFPINATDALWAKYSLGERWKVNDPNTGTWAKRNIYGADFAALQARGTKYWQCNNALNHIVTDLAAATHAAEPAVREELVAGLNPGVRIVPAHSMALGLAQEHGCSYQKV